jgi:hypothetical protein
MMNFSPGRARFLLISMLLFLSYYQAGAQKESKKNKVVELEVDFGLATLYDNNILKYSDKYLQKFINNEDSGRFHISTYDDVILTPSLGLTATSRIFGNLRSELSVDYSSRIYIVNSIKNWNYFAVGFRQYLPKRASFRLSYSYIPTFYIRHYRDDDWVAVYGYVPETFQPMGFSKNSYGLWVQKAFFKNTTFRLSFSYSQYYYNKHYTEYDSKDQFYGIRLFQTVNESFRMELAYEFIYSEAKGYDEPGEIKKNADESDASFYEHGFFARGVYKLPPVLKLKHNLDIEIGYMKRYFTSEHYLELDPLHVGRVDDVIELSASYNVRLLKSLNMSVFYNYFFRDANTSATENQTLVSDEKDYRANQVGLSLNYYLKF